MVVVLTIKKIELFSGRSNLTIWWAFFRIYFTQNRFFACAVSFNSAIT